MAKLPRVTLTQFGLTGPTASFAEFGSQAASAPIKTKDPATIQSLSAWVTGWQAAVALGEAPYLEDMNGLLYVLSYMLCYGFQEGVAEYDSGTTYFTGSLIKRTGTSEIYMSLVNTNVGNALPTAGTSDANWQFVSGLISGAFRIGGDILIPDGVISAPGIGFASEPGSGLYRIGTGHYALVVSGAKAIDITASSVLGLYASGNAIVEIAATVMRPGADNSFGCGESGRRWTAVWAVNGTIQTSMSHTKHAIEDIPIEELIIPRAIRFVRNGDASETVHMGFLADDLPEDAHPLDPATEKRSPDDIETSAVISMLCLAARDNRNRINSLETMVADLTNRLVALEGKK